jgi:hypothetical protein
MSLDLGRILSRTFSICWRNRWLWVLGVFGGGGGIGAGIQGGFNYSPGAGTGRRGGSAISEAQLTGFLHDWAWLLLLIGAVVLLIIVAAFLLACVAVPASIWSALTLDAGRPARLREAWREGVARFWRYFRLYLLRFLISVALLLLAVVMVGVGALIFASAGTGSLWVLIPLAVVFAIVFAIASILISFFFAWSERTAFILDVGAVAALRSSARLARGAWVDTLVFAVVMGVIVGLVDIGITIAAAVIVAPGVVLLVIGVLNDALAIAIIGALLAVVLGGGAFVVGAGFVGSLVQVSYALACRDLCQRFGMQVAPTIPVATKPAPSGLMAPPPAPA